MGSTAFIIDLQYLTGA